MEIRERLIGCKVTTDYYENEVFKIVDVRESEFLLRGDWWGLDNFVLCKRPHREGIKQCGLKDKILEYLI